VAKDKLTIKRLFLAFSGLICIFMLGSCASTGLKREVQIPKELKQPKVEEVKPPELKIPEFAPATEDISPLKTRIVDIVARNTPLRDVLHVIADATSLNLVMEKGVTPETPVTITLKNVTAEDALHTILSSVNYFYTAKNNMLLVKAIDTRIFELGFPSVIQNYNVEVGGDIFGGVTGDLTQTSGGGGGGGGGGGSTGIKGNITQTLKADEAAFNFWQAVEKSLGSILGQTGGGAGGQAGGESAGGEYFTVNRVTGTIVVVASKRTLERVEQYVNTLKKVMGRQVLIEAKVIEVTLSEGFQFGIDWTLVQRNLNIDETRTTSSLTLGTSGFKQVAPTTIGGPVFTITGAPSFGGRRADLNFVMNALEQQGELRILSNPRINMMNGQTALLVVGRNESYIKKVETTTTQGTPPITTFTTETGSVLSGLTIGIVPYINEQGEISLTITPIIAERVSFETKNIGAVGNQTEIKLPTVDLRELSTTVKVRDGQTVVIGGLIKKSEKLTDSQVPFLGNVPLIGYLFKSRDKTEIKTELVIALQPLLL
jgi:MSHA type pilus biogenesis protein MshL